MLRELVQKIKNLTVEPVAFDPSALGDAVAMRTEWGPAKNGGASFGTHRLVEVGTVRVEFRPAPGAIIFYLVFLISGLGLSVGFAIAFLSGTIPSGASSSLSLLIPIGVGLVFAAVGGWMFYDGAAPIVFDKRSGEYWKGRSGPANTSSQRKGNRHTKLDRIHALQIISEYCRGNKTSYYSYELNLVLADGTRINVIDHGDQAKLREDATTLARFLGKPLWDATARTAAT